MKQSDLTDKGPIEPELVLIQDLYGLLGRGLPAISIAIESAQILPMLEPK